MLIRDCFERLLNNVCNASIYDVSCLMNLNASSHQVQKEKETAHVLLVLCLDYPMITLLS